MSKRKNDEKGEALEKKTKMQADTFNNPMCCDTEECECGICFEKKPLLELLPCKHYFCRECIINAFTFNPQYLCPNCRMPVARVGCKGRYVPVNEFVVPRSVINNDPPRSVIHNDPTSRSPNDPTVINYVNQLAERFNEYYQEIWPDIQYPLQQILADLWDQISPYHAQNRDRRTIISSGRVGFRQIVNLLNQSHPERRLNCDDENFIRNKLAEFINFVKGYQEGDINSIQGNNLNDRSTCIISGGRKNRKSRKSRRRKSRKSRRRKSRKSIRR
jgi:hypothetical protein